MAYLIKNRSFQTSDSGNPGSHALKLVDVNLCSSQNSGSTTWFMALSDYLSGEKAKCGGSSKLLRVWWNEEKPTEFFLGIRYDVLKTLAAVVPSSYLQIEGNIKDNGGSSLTTFDKRFEFNDLLTAEQSVDTDGKTEVYQSFASAAIVDGGCCKFSVLIGREDITEVQIDMSCFIQKLFDDESTKDFTIVARGDSARSEGEGEGDGGDGETEIKCHKLMLSAQSAVLAKLVSSTNELEGGQTGRVDMKEHSAEGIRLILQYLYGLKLEIKSISCDLVVELLQLAHKFELMYLEKNLCSFLLQNDKTWFTADVILELYFYTKKVELKDFMQLRDYSMRVMSSMNIEELRSCKAFKKLDAESGFDLVCKLVGLLQI